MRNLSVGGGSPEDVSFHRFPGPADMSDSARLAGQLRLSATAAIRYASPR
jgi:hypothetical protein